MLNPRSAFRRIGLAAIVSLFALPVLPAQANYQHAVGLYNSGEFTAALQELLPLARHGDIDAERTVGLMYEHGRGVHQDYAAALKWLKRAAMDGEPYAMRYVGILYANGKGTAADPVEGWAWVSLAAEQNVPGAKKDLASIAKLLSAQGLACARARSADLRDRVDSGEKDSGYRGLVTTSAVSATQMPPASFSAEHAGLGSATQRWESWQGDGFTLRHPVGWKVTSNSQGAVHIAGTRGEDLFVWPLFSRRPISDGCAARFLHSITRKLEPNGRLARARLVMPGALKAEGAWGGREYAASLVWTNTPNGDAATYVLASAPRGVLGSAAPAFAKIMNSLSLHGNGAPSGISRTSSVRRVAYTVFRDSTEGAFTVDVPVGWRVKGGVARFNASDVRPWLRLMSRDGRIRVFMGDPRIPSMLVPNRSLALMGFTEGTTYDAGYNQRFLVKFYYPGKESAKLYAETNLSNDCQDAVTEEYRNRPELSAAINEIFRAYRSPFARQELDTGEISRSCPNTGRAQYVFAGTFLSQFPTAQGTFSMWVLNYLYGFDAPRQDAATALAVTRHLADSFRVTDQWARMNGGLQSHVSAIVARTDAAISKGVSEAYWNAQHTSEKSMEKYEKANLDVQETLDPVTGEKIEIVAGVKHAWIDHKGNVVGTRTDTCPGIDYRRLVMLDK